MGGGGGGGGGGGRRVESLPADLRQNDEIYFGFIDLTKKGRVSINDGEYFNPHHSLRTLRPVERSNMTYPKLLGLKL